MEWIGRELSGFCRMWHQWNAISNVSIWNAALYTHTHMCLMKCCAALFWKLDFNVDNQFRNELSNFFRRHHHFSLSKKFFSSLVTCDAHLLWMETLPQYPNQITDKRPPYTYCKKTEKKPIETSTIIWSIKAQTSVSLLCVAAAT